jgi:uncharacterized protein (TIGR03437 family)
MAETLLKRAVLAAMLLAAGTQRSAASEVTLPDGRQAVAPGSSVVAPIGFAAQAGSVTGIQFDLEYDNMVIGVAASAGDAARGSAKTLYTGDLTERKKRFMIVGLNQDLIPDGVLVNLHLHVRAAAPDGPLPVKLSDVVATDANGLAAPATANSGQMAVDASLGPPVRLHPAGVLNAASLLPGPVAPGELITLIGSGIGPAVPLKAEADGAISLEGTAVLFDDAAAPLLWGGPDQINAVVPFAVAGKNSTVIRIVSQDLEVAAVEAPVAAVAPAIFTQDGSGSGPGVIFHEDGTMIGPASPTAAGAAVTLLATGAGVTDPPGVDGLPATEPLPKPVARPIYVQIGGQEAPVQYALAAPGLPGMLQIKCIVPHGVGPGWSVPISFTMGTTTSPPGVTLAVR